MAMARARTDGVLTIPILLLLLLLFHTFPRFVDSEVALDNAIQELLLLTQNPKDFYPELIKLGIVGSLVDLLSREYR